MPGVRVRENEHFDAALRRFKRACEKAGVLTELRRREFYEKPTQERKRKKAAAVKRQQKKSARETSRRVRLYNLASPRICLRDRRLACGMPDYPGCKDPGPMPCDWTTRPLY